MMNDPLSRHAPIFRGGPNVAMKVGKDKIESVVEFYRNVLGLSTTDKGQGTWTVDFGHFVLWLDPSESAKGEIWLEVVVEDIEQAREFFNTVPGSLALDAEPLPDGYPGFWIRNPAGFVHLVSKVGA